MADDRRGHVWGLIAAHAAGHGGAVSAADVCAVAVSLVQVSGAWVTAASGRAPDVTMHVTDPVSEQLAEVQLMLGEGPGHDALTSMGPVLAGDLDDAESARRWPAFAPAARQLGAAALFAFPLTIGAIRAGMMGLYRGSPGPLATRLGDCLILADAATMLLLDRLGHHPDGDGTAGGNGDGAGPGGQSLDPMLHRAEIDQATGMLTVQLDTTAAEAFARLRAYAYAQDRRLADVARDIVHRRLRLGPDAPEDADS